VASWRRIEILAGLDAIIPFAEIPDPYYDPDTRSITGTIVANMGSRMSFLGEPVILEPTEEWLHRINTFTFAVYDENDVEIASGAMQGWYKPMTVVRWLRDQLRDSGKELMPGQILSLGNIGIIRQLHENSPIFWLQASSVVCCCCHPPSRITVGADTRKRLNSAQRLLYSSLAIRTTGWLSPIATIRSGTCCLRRQRAIGDLVSIKSR